MNAKRVTEAQILAAAEKAGGLRVYNLRPAGTTTDAPTAPTLYEPEHLECGVTPELTPGQWAEYDGIAKHMARHKLKGDYGDPLPDFISPAVHDEINEHVEEFMARVQSSAYMLASEGPLRIGSHRLTTDSKKPVETTADR